MSCSTIVRSSPRTHSSEAKGILTSFRLLRAKRSGDVVLAVAVYGPREFVDASKPYKATFIEYANMVGDCQDVEMTDATPPKDQDAVPFEVEREYRKRSLALPKPAF